MTWDPNVDQVVLETPKKPPVLIDLDTLDDGRCKASSWRVKWKRPTYENIFGIAGFNRCIGPDGHANHLHKDEWGQVFRTEPSFRVLWTED